ncbi:TPA: hypothetical protein PXE99_001635 [Mannheimia haemolytica]|nr:hypothetical protein [Mannheimia haemolytica]
MQKYQPEIHRRRSIRLKHYDYRSQGFYFITLCCKNKHHFLGEIVDDEMRLNKIGNIVRQCWEDIPDHFPNVSLHSFVIMPNHLHGIIEIVETVGANHHLPQCIRAKNVSPLRGTSQTIGSIVRGFKIGVTKWVRQNTDISEIWQRNYYEHIIRNETSYFQIIEYIENNPLKWLEDCFYS